MRRFDVHRAPGRRRPDVPLAVVPLSRAVPNHPRRPVASRADDEDAARIIAAPDMRITRSPD